MVRKILFWIHLVAGLVAAIPLVVMAVTGIVLSFEHQIVDMARGESRFDSSSRLPLDTLVARATGEGALRISAVVVWSDPARALELRQGRERTLRVDPSTGEVLHRGERLEATLQTVERIHRWLGFRKIGGKVTGVSVLLCLVLSCTGLVIWWPRHLAALGQVLWPRWGLRGRVRDWQWHNSVGLLVLPGLVLLSLTGTVLSWKWAEALLYAAAGSEAPRPAPPARTGAIDRAKVGPGEPRAWQAWLDTALAHAPADWKTVWLSAPAKPGAGPAAIFRTTLDPVPSGGTVVLGVDGSFASWKPTRADQATRWRYLVKPLHTGELFGVPGQAAMAIASMGVLVLVWTGTALAWRRLRRRRP